MANLSIAYMLCNRGRNIENDYHIAQQYIHDNQSFIFLVDESDNTDLRYGLNGRKILQLLKSKYSQAHHYIADNQNIGINFLTSENIKVSDIKYELINKWNLIFKQGRSEKYEHYRLITRLEDENGQVINLVVQHNSAFIRPITRFWQSYKSMKILKDIQKKEPSSLAILVRDQNTMFPGEGKLERFLRLIFRLNCLTDKVKRLYNLDKLEGDTGGLNAFAVWFNKIGGFKFLRYFITISDKIESMCILKGKDSELGLTITPYHTQILKSDHGMISINIENN